MREQYSVLIVEDDERLARAVAETLRNAQYAVRLATTGADALQEVRESPPDLVLLDLGLPDIDGMSVCREVVALRGPRVVVITGRDDADTAEKALELGADDYVRKPFSLNELRARVRATLRRCQPDGQDVLRAGRLEIDPNRCTVSVDDRVVQLSGTELRLLMFLAAHPGWVFSKEHLLEALWPEDRATHAVQVHISNVRRKIESDPSEPKIIVTIKGLGYKLVV